MQYGGNFGLEENEEIDGMIKAIVLDDESISGEWLGEKLRKTGMVDVVNILQNPFELTEHLTTGNIDVVFMDIEMPEISGIELAMQLSMLEISPEIIFVTAYAGYALDAFRANALDYLVKPVIIKDLERVLAKLEKRLNSKRIELDGSPSQPAIKKRCLSITDINLKFPTAKCEELFLYMLLRNRQLISKWEIIEDLWPDKGPEKGGANIRTTAFRLNQVLEKQGLDLRVKSSKGYYHFIPAACKNEIIAIRQFPQPESLQHTEGSVLETLKKYNFLDIIEEKDYMWLVRLKEYENAYFKWAMEVLEPYRERVATYLQALYYLYEQFPWKEALLAEIMPLIVKVEGTGALIHFFQQQAEGDSQAEIKLSQTIMNIYQKLLQH